MAQTKRKDISKALFVAIALVGTAARICLSLTQFATIYPPLAPLDDHLMTKAAMSIVEGRWLGEYGWLTISKHMGFSVWLAFLHVLGIPYLAGNTVLWCAACLIAAAAFRPAVPDRLRTLILYLALVWSPSASAQYATRVYRDSIFPRLCLIFFSCVAGAGLRHEEKLSKRACWLAGYGLAFGAVYLSREDGVWVLPFFAAALVIILIIERKEGAAKLVRTAVSMTAPFLLGAALIALYCSQNRKRYGRFIVGDFDSGEFKSAYGAMTSLEQDDWKPLVAVPGDVREDLYREIPMFAPVKQALQEPLLVNGYYDTELGDFRSGAFYWALRSALASLGIYDDPETAKTYYEELTARIQRAVDRGDLKTQSGTGKLRKSLTPPIRGEYVAPVLEETFRGARMVLTFADCDPLAERAVGKYEEEIRPVEEFIHQKGATALIENTDTPYLSPPRALTHGLLRLIQRIYSVLMPLAFVASLFWQIKKLLFDLRFGLLDADSLLNIIMLGLLGMGLLRCAMIAFMEVSSFGIGTYVMYLSSVHPLYVLYRTLGALRTYDS